MGEGFDWFYASAADRAAQTRTPITDGAHSKPWIYRPKDIRAWWLNQHYDRPGGSESASPTAWAAQSKPIIFTEYGCPAVDRGSNQPNVFYDPKSSESAVPHHSRGWRDDRIQRAYLEAMLGYWGAGANNPTSSAYGAPMIELESCAAWAWDARPYPDFPARLDVWSDGGNWQFGHWLGGRLGGRLGSASVAALVRRLCEDGGLDAGRVDASGLYGAVEGFVIPGLQAPRVGLEQLARFFGFDAVESGGNMVFTMRGRRAALTLTPDDLVPTGSADAHAQAFELTRAQETELPQALKWQLGRSDEAYAALGVEARRSTVTSRRISAESFPFAATPEEAMRGCTRLLAEIWTGIETARLALPAARLALDPGDVVTLLHDGRRQDFRIVSAADNRHRALDLVRVERGLYDLPPGQPRTPHLSNATSPVAPLFELMDLPQLNAEHQPHQPLIMAWSSPWPGILGIWRGAEVNDVSLALSLTRRSRIGALAADLPAAASGLWDRGSELLIDLNEGTLESVSDLALFAGANSFAVETAPGIWEVLQGSDVSLISASQSTRRYRITRLLRGQRGSEDAIADPALAGARLVVLDADLRAAPVDLAEIGVSQAWHAGALSATPDQITGLSFTPAGRGLMPFAPAHAKAARAAGSDDVEVSWIRRDRAPAADSWVLFDVPMSEDSEAYEIEVLSLDGASVLRSITGLASAVWTYPAADQVIDYGSAPVASLRLRIFQIGQLRGVALERILVVT